MAPMEEMSCLSNSGIQFAPPSVVFQTPPATAPKYHVFGSPKTPSMASARPPRNGPTCRQRMPLKSFGSTCGAVAGETAGEGDGAAEMVPPKMMKAKAAKLAANRNEGRKIMARKLQEVCARFNYNRSDWEIRRNAPEREAERMEESEALPFSIRLFRFARGSIQPGLAGSFLGQMDPPNLPLRAFSLPDRFAAAYVLCWHSRASPFLL